MLCSRSRTTCSFSSSIDDDDKDEDKDDEGDEDEDDEGDEDEDDEDGPIRSNQANSGKQNLNPNDHELTPIQAMIPEKTVHSWKRR